MTGRYPLRLGIEKAFNHRFDYDGWQDLGIAAAHNRNEITIATHLHRAGYATGIFGKWHLGKNRAANPVRHGFDEFRGLTCGCGDYFSKLTRYGEPDWWHNDQLEFQEGYATTVSTQNAVRFIERHRDRPFVLYVPYSAIHFPWQSSEDGALPVRLRGQLVDRPGQVSKIGPHERAAEIPGVARRMIEELDAGVGRIVAALRQHGLERRTLVLFTSDNGGYNSYPVKGTRTEVSSNAPWRGGKGQVYEGGHRVPAVAWWPGTVPAGAVIAETAVTMDLLPTALDLAGLPHPAPRGPNALDGVSLLPTLLRAERLVPRTLYWQSAPDQDGKSQWGIRQGTWKLVDGELYNLAIDPVESRDRAAEHPELVRELRSQREAWERRIRSSKDL
jgi:arylsulfatase A-like enzyme